MHARWVSDPACVRSRMYVRKLSHRMSGSCHTACPRTSSRMFESFFSHVRESHGKRAKASHRRRAGTLRRECVLSFQGRLGALCAEWSPPLPYPVQPSCQCTPPTTPSRVHCPHPATQTGWTARWCSAGSGRRKSSGLRAGRRAWVEDSAQSLLFLM